MPPVGYIEDKTVCQVVRITDLIGMVDLFCVIYNQINVFLSDSACHGIREFRIALERFGKALCLKCCLTTYFV